MNKKDVCERLYIYWGRQPNLRLGELITNSVPYSKLFYIEDSELLHQISVYLESVEDNNYLSYIYKSKYIYDRLLIAWNKMPSLRLGQLLSNAIGDLSLLSDSEIIDKVEEFSDRYSEM